METEYSYALNQKCSLELYPEENAWHYITVQPTVSNKIIEFSISVVITGMAKSYLINIFFNIYLLNFDLEIVTKTCLHLNISFRLSSSKGKEQLFIVK